MPSIFVCYRREDLHSGVEQLVHVLKDHFGEEEVYLDRESFVAGEHWAAQNRSLVARADVILCAIGPAWNDEAVPGRRVRDVDYLQEELELGRSLGKPIIPVYIGHDGRDVFQNFSERFQWLRIVQCINGVLSTGGGSLVINAIENVAGASQSKGVRSSGKTSAWLDAFIVLCRSLVYPTGVGASSLKPSRHTFELAWRQLVLALTSFLFMQGALNVEAYSIADAGIVTLGFGLSTLLVFGCFSLLAIVVRSSVPLLSRVNFSLQISSTSMFMSVLLLVAVSLLFPIDDVRRILSASESGEDLARSAVALIGELGEKNPARGISFLALCFIVGMGSVRVWWGYIRAGTLALGWRWQQMALFTALILAGAYAVIVGGPILLVDSSSNSNEFVFVSARDYETPSGLVQKPIQISASVHAEVGGKAVRVRINEMVLENRTDTVFTAMVVGGLTVFQDGKWDYPKNSPTQASNWVPLPKSVPPHGRESIRVIELIIPLPSCYLSGQTGLRVFVNDIDLSPGRENVLHWADGGRSSRELKNLSESGCG